MPTLRELGLIFQGILGGDERRLFSKTYTLLDAARDELRRRDPNIQDGTRSGRGEVDYPPADAIAILGVIEEQLKNPKARKAKRMGITSEKLSTIKTIIEEDYS